MSLSFNARHRFACLSLIYALLLLAEHTPSARAQDPGLNLTDCTIPSDQNAQFSFRLTLWVNRGSCVRTRNTGESCDAILDNILYNLKNLRQSEYGAAASVLSLLPTIGALFGPPTSEIWRLKSTVPFAGFLAMTLSFGGALMPVRVKDYENTVAKQNTAIGSIISLRKQQQLPGNRKSMEQTIDEKLHTLGDKVRERIDQHESLRLPKFYLFIGMLGMIVLFAMAQAAIAVVENGGVISWWCQCRVWMHMWYIFVTFTAFTEDRVQRPFVKTYKLYVSSLPYDVDTYGGQPITDYFSSKTPSENVAIALKQLKTLKPASLTVHGSRLQTRCRNSVMVMVSVVGHNKGDNIWRLLSKTLSVTVFVTGTAVFASVTLLSLIMAIVVLTLTLAAGVFGRAIAGWIVGRVSGIEPVIHIISNDEQEAYQAITEVLCLKSNDGTAFQVEVNGHIFINERRVANRSSLVIGMLGVLAEPYDVTKAHQETMLSPSTTMAFAALSPRPTNVSTGDNTSMPFLPNTGNPSPFAARTENGTSKSTGSQNARRASNDSLADSNHQIPRKPLLSNEV